MGTGSSTSQGRNTTYGTRDARRYSADNSYWPELAGAQLAESSGTGRNPYIVPLPKPNECFSKSLNCDDFRGIVISPILSKVFEHCVLDRFKDYLVTSDNQLGFKKNVGCSFAIRTVHNIVDSYISAGCTANLCAIDL